MRVVRPFTLSNPEDGVGEVVLAPQTDGEPRKPVFLSPHQFISRCCTMELQYQMLCLQLSTSLAPFPDSAGEVAAVFEQMPPVLVWRGSGVEGRRQRGPAPQPEAPEAEAEGHEGSDGERREGDRDDDHLLDKWLEGLADGAASSTDSSSDNDTHSGSSSASSGSSSRSSSKATQSLASVDSAAPQDIFPEAVALPEAAPADKAQLAQQAPERPAGRASER